MATRTIHFLFLISYFSFVGQATGTVSGVVVDITSGVPIAGAVVVVTGDDNGIARCCGTRTTTDANGRFRLPALSAGRWRMSATAPGFSVAGPERLFITGNQTDLPPLTLSAPQQAAVSGTVVEEDGTPAAGVRVIAYRDEDGGAGTRLTAAGQTTTNDLGQFLLEKLQPGQYKVCACPTFGSVAVRDTGTGPSAVLRAQAKGINVTQMRVLLEPRWHPSAESPAQATLLDVDSGATRAGVDITITRRRGFTVRGRITGTEEPLHAASVRVIPDGWDAIMNRPDVALRVEQDGRFELQGLPPGHYTIDVRHRLRAPHEGPSGTLAPPGPNAGVVPPFSTFSFFSHAASVPFTIDRSDIPDLEVPLRATPELVVHLRLTAEAVKDDVVRPRTTLLLRHLTDGTTVGPARRGPDDQWVFDGVPPGDYVLTTDNLDETLVVIDDAGASASAIRIGSDKPAPILATVTPAVRGTVQGSISGAMRPERTSLVLLFPRDSRAWATGTLTRTRFIEVPVDQLGSFLVSGVPGGDYLVAAVDAATLRSEWRIPGNLALLAGLGIPATVSSAGAVNVTVPLR